MKICLLFIMLSIFLPRAIYSQDDWHFVDESATRLPDTITLSDCLDGGPLRPGGYIDLLVGQSPVPFYNLPGVAQLFLNNGYGYFNLADSSNFPQRNDYTSDVKLFDADGDGDLDAFFVNYNRITDYIAINNGNGIFHIDWSRLPVDSAVAIKGDFADIDNDGDIDVCLLGNNEVMSSHRMWMNNGSGYFHDEIDRLPALRSFYRYVGFADLNGDLAPDIVAVYYDSPANESHPEIFMNDGSGHFSNETEHRFPPTESNCWIAALADIDNDGDYDILLSYVNRIGFLINDGTGHFTDETNERGPAIIGGATAYGIFDADDDGDEDLIMGRTNIHPEFIFVNDGTGHFEDQSDLRMPNIYTDTRDLFVGDLDGDGDVDAFRVGAGNCVNNIYINTLNVRDSIPPSIKNQIILPVFDTLSGPYPVKLIAQDGVSIEYQLSCFVHYSTDRINFYSDSLHYTGGFIFYGTIPETDSGTTVYYYYTATDKEGNESMMPRNAPDSVFSFSYMPGYVGIDAGSNALPGKLAISAYPNPFNAQTSISYSLLKLGPVKLFIYNLLGEKVATLSEGIQIAGQHSIIWDANDDPSGIYFARLESAGQWKCIKMVLLK